MGSFDKVPLTGGKSYYNKQEGDWWQQANLPERLDDDYSEMESTFMERQTPGGVKYTSAPGQYPPPSVRRTRRDDLDWDSSSDERGVSLGRSGRVFRNGSLGWYTHCSDVFVLQRFLGILLKKNGRPCLWG